MSIQSKKPFIYNWMFLSVFTFFLICLSTHLFAESNLPALSSQPPIKIGMSTPLTGPSQVIGQEMKRGVEIYFNKINANNGINGRKIELIALDDKYEPTLTAPNMHRLIEQDKVLAIIGNVGTPTGLVSVPIVNKGRVLLFGPLSGADLFRKSPPDRYVINFRASYDKEISSLIKGLLSIGIKPDEFAFFTQNDSYGDAGYQIAIKTLKAAGYSTPDKLPYGRYERNTLNVIGGLATIVTESKKTPKAILTVGTYVPTAKFIQLAKKQFPDALFLNISFIGSAALMKELVPNEENIIISEVVPPLDSSLPAAQEYRMDLEKYAPGATPDFVSFEGYLVAKLFVMGLRQAAEENKLTREGLIDVFENMKNINIGLGNKISFDKMDHQAMDEVWPVILKDKKFVPLNWNDLKLWYQEKQSNKDFTTR
jgi:ABC-type branched-subunit amino acid transport system substrate-binding protein